MESTQDRLGHNLVTNRNAVSAQSGLLLAGPQVGDAWSETRMWPAPIVVCDPLLEKAPQVPLVERDQKIEAFRRTVPINRSQNAFAWGAWKGAFNIFRSIAFKAESSSDE